MKHLGKILLSLATLFALIQITHSGALGVEKIDVLDENTLSVTLSENPNVKVGNVDAEITVLSDMKIRGAVLSADNAKKIDILLDNPLQANTSYSLLTINGAEGSIDFTTPAGVEGFIQENISSIQSDDIDMIEVIDSRTLTVTYIQDLSEGSYEYKLLAESKVDSIEKAKFDDSFLTIKVTPPFVGEQDYILMIIDMQDVDGKHLEFDTGIYDFTTPAFTASVEVDSTSSGAILPAEQATDTTVVVDDELEVMQVAGTETAEVIEDGEIDLNAAGAESEDNLEEVALAATDTPDTGAATWILVFATLVINSIYYIARRKKMQLA
ncbi:hypothetical protein GW846_03945 [Candidatus Gracilibacteria bacterium]|nr:hypothetical protein [Candidatus Gracilibacteria bacterium]